MAEPPKNELNNPTPYLLEKMMKAGIPEGSNMKPLEEVLCSTLE
jgi:hypothetical protein